MSTDKGNRPAFPNHKDTSEWREGITIRDYFAAKAMQGLMTMEDKGTHKSMEDCYSKIAELSYGVADAMLEQREL